MRTSTQIFIYRLLQLILIVAGKTLFLLKATGTEHIPSGGGVILAVNHASNLDPFLAGTFVRRPIRFFTKQEAFRNPVLRWLLEDVVECIPVNRAGADRKAMRRAVEGLKKGDVLMMFPEGTRSPDGNLQPFQPGIGMIAWDAGARIVPVYIAGTHAVWPKGRKIFRPGRVRVYYGESFEPHEAVQTLENEESHNKKDIYRAIARHTEQKIKELKNNHEVL